MLRAALSTRRIPMIYYALAAYEDLDAFRDVSPEFLSETYFIDILTTPPILDNHEHKFEVDTASRAWVIHSKSILGKGSVLTWEDVLKKIKQKEIGVPIETFSANVKKSKQGIDIPIRVGKKTSKTSTQSYALVLE